MFIGLGMYCMGGFIVGVALSIPIAIVIIQQRRKKEQLKKETAQRLREYEAGEREAYRLNLTNETE